MQCIKYEAKYVDFTRNPIWVVQIIEQTCVGRDFASGGAFKSVKHSVVLVSCNEPENSIKYGVIHVRGTYSEYDYRPLVFNNNKEFELFKDLVAQYNMVHTR